MYLTHVNRYYFVLLVKQLTELTIAHIHEDFVPCIHPILTFRLRLSALTTDRYKQKQAFRFLSGLPFSSVETVSYRGPHRQIPVYPLYLNRRIYIYASNRQLLIAVMTTIG